MSWDPDKIQEVADDLMGTAKSLDDVIEEKLKCSLDDLPTEALLHLDSLVLQCTGCGWWFESGEMHLAPNESEYVCSDCNPAKEEE